MPWDICILVYYLSICFRDTLLIFWWILESLSLCVCGGARYLFLIFEIFARDYYWWIDVVQCYLHIGIVNIHMMAKMRAMKEWKIWKLWVEKWIVCRFCQCKLNPVERDVNSRMNSFISWWELGVLGLRKSDPLSSFFCCCRNPKIGLPARQCRFFVTIARNLWTWKSHLSSWTPINLHLLG